MRATTKNTVEAIKRILLVGAIAIAVLLGLGFILMVPLLSYAGFALLCMWVLAVAGVCAFVLPLRAMPIGALIALLAAGCGFVAGDSAPALLCWLGAAGVALGMAARARLEAKNRSEKARIDALPLWERDELGAAAAELRPAYRREPRPQPVAEPHVTAKIVAAVTAPLPGATVIVSTNSARPVLAVYGSRVAIVYGPGAGVGVAPADTSELVETIVEHSLPQGARYQVFELEEGLAEPAAGRVSFTLAQPHELAAFLGGGAPANGDALFGRAAHLHHKTLVTLAHNGLYAGEL